MTTVTDFIKSLLRNPGKIYLLGISVFFFFSFVCIPILSSGHPGGEQRPMTLLSYAVNYLFFSFFIVALITTIACWKWFKKYWYVNLSILIVTSYVIIKVYFLKDY